MNGIAPPGPDAPGEPRADSRTLSRALAAALRPSMALDGRPAVTASPGTLLLKAGEPVRRLPLLLEGRIDTFMHLHSAQDAPVMPVSFHAGELVLLSQLFCERRSIVDLVAGTTVRLQWIPMGDIEAHLLRDHPALVLLVRFLGQRLREVQTREQTWIQRGARERVGAVVARLAAAAPAAADGSRTIVATHDEIAARCGVSRPRTSLALKRLEQEGVLDLGRGRLRVLDLERLGAPPLPPG